MIEQVARASAEELRAGTTSDVAAGLADLHVRHRRHRRHTRVGAVAAVALAVGLGWAGGTTLTHRDDRGLPPTHPAPSGNHADASCPTLGVRCLGDHTYRFALVRPVDWHIPTGFGVASGSGVMPLRVESYRDDGWAGVTVLERVRASAPGGGTAPRVADSPKAFVQWIASRPYLSAGPVRSTTFDGHRAWQVRVTLAPGAARGPSVTITYQPTAGSTGLVGHEMAQYTVFRLPGAGTTLVESWIFHPNTDSLGALDKVVHGLSWPTD